MADDTGTEVPLKRNLYWEKCTEDMLKELAPLIREEDYAEARRLAREKELATVIQYLSDNVPDVNMYLSSLPAESTDEQKMAVIKNGLKKRAEALVPSYSMPPPFLGNDIEEARSKRTYPYKGYVVTPYIEQPSVGRSKVGRNPKPKSARFKFI